ncbi:MAG TPA: NAD(P)-binding domain-containing protein [Pilimelia sp.]|nr:NAD(P)-binding domain-containing protein [Pilimelia sp.]
MGLVSILGAGPYGLAVAAHLKNAGLDTVVFGVPMSFWSGHMPTGMLLRSPRVASSISDPHGKLDLDGFGADTGVSVGSPVPLDAFVAYGHWFQANAVPEVDRRNVEQVRRRDGGFELALADGERVTADRVVVATGIARYAYVPPVLRDLPDTAVSHASAHTDLGRFAGQRVLVVGGGQSALESAALLHEAGAEVEVAARAPGVHWLGQHGWLRSLGPVTTLLYAPPEVGPPLVSQLVRVPGVVRRLPARPRHAIDRRSMRPAGAGWLRPRVDGRVPIHVGRVVTRAEVEGGRVALDFDDGARDTVDHVLLGTGYRVDIARNPFLPADLLAGVRQVAGYPVLGRGFESSVPGLHFVGATAAWSYGPLMRFVAGTPFAAAEVTRFLAAPAGRAARGAVVRP